MNNDRRFWTVVILVLIAIFLNLILFLSRNDTIREHIFPAIPPTPEQIAQAVDEYCNDRDDCRGEMGLASQIPGPKGDDGKDGRDSNVPGPAGADSTVPGPQGRPPTSEEVAAAVTAYCESNNNCRGEQGNVGRSTEWRCNTETQQWETRLEGDELWEPVEGSDCISGNGQPLESHE